MSGRRVPTVGRWDGHADELLDVAEKRRLIGVAEGDGHAIRAGARGAPDPMHIGFRHIGQIEVHDVADAVDIDAARRDIGRNQGSHAAIAEPGKRPLALVLRFVGVDCRMGSREAFARLASFRGK